MNRGAKVPGSRAVAALAGTTVQTTSLGHDNDDDTDCDCSRRQQTDQQASVEAVPVRDGACNYPTRHDEGGFPGTALLSSDGVDGRVALATKVG